MSEKTLIPKKQLNMYEHFYVDAYIRIDTDVKSVEDVPTEILRCLKGFGE